MLKKFIKWATTPCSESPKKQKQCKIVHVAINTMIALTIVAIIAAMVTFFWALI